MNEYKVYFEMFNRKMVTTVYADDEAEAMNKVSEKINFIKVDRVYDKDVESLMNMFGMKK
jgi:hypothetical protein